LYGRRALGPVEGPALSSPEGREQANHKECQRSHPLTIAHVQPDGSPGPLTLLTLPNLVAAWRSTGRERTWWFAASFAVLAD